MMRVGLVGLGRMGGNMARRLMAGEHQVVASDRHAEMVLAIDRDGRQWRLSPS